jgi:hypothetical protein
MRPLVARIHRALGELARRAGRDREADIHLGTAATMLREMNVRAGDESEPARALALRHEGDRAR